MIKTKIKLPDGFLEEEERCGFLVTRKMKEIWAVELDLLAEFMRVADKHGIKYMANGGTMLGAARHKGFIPWDDDIDLMMMRSEYERLCEIAPKEFRHPYFFQTEDTDPGSLRCHAQLRNSETTAILENEHSPYATFNQGIFIDIFPLDAVPDNEEDWNREWPVAQKYYERMCSCASLSSHYSAKSPWVKRILHTIGSPFFTRLAKYYFRKYEQECKKFNHQHTRLLSLYCWGYKYKKLHRLRADHEETVMMPFEFLRIPVSKNYDHALTEMFGDWHQFVKGGSVHGGVIFDTDRPYTDYI